jgi:hypothetical protein
VVLTAGVHGDEPAGVETVARFLEQRPSWARGFQFTIFPCMNPHGYDHNLRNNYDNLDINRQYHHSSLPEVDAQKRVLAGRRFDLHITLHEDVDAPGFYVYELSRRRLQIARKIAARVARILPLDTRPIIEGRRSREGVIHRAYPPRDMKHWPEAIYMFAAHCDHTLTTETPGAFEFERRVKAQTIALRTACETMARLKRRAAAADR